MKKLSILLIGLLLVTGLAFAQEVAVSGEATITFGIDLDGTPSTGFENAGTASYDITWSGDGVDAGTEGWISVDGWAIGVDVADDGDDANGLDFDPGSVTAGWMFDPLTITIYAGPEFSGGEAAGIAYDEKDEVTVGLAAVNGNGYNGLTIDVALGAADLTLLVASDGTWDDNDGNDYVLGAEVGTVAGPATIAAGVYAGPLSDVMDLAFDLGVDLVAGPATIGIGFDAAVPSGLDLVWDASLDVGLDVAGIGVDVATYFYTIVDLDMDLSVALDLSGLVEALTLTETFQTVSVLTDAFTVWESATSVGYAVSDQVAASADFTVDSANLMTLDIVVTLTGFVENTVFELAYGNTDLENLSGLISFAATISTP